MKICCFFCNGELIWSLTVQRHSRRLAEEQDIEDAFELLYKINEMSGLEYGLGIVSFITPLPGDLITVLLLRYAYYGVTYL